MSEKLSMAEIIRIELNPYNKEIVIKSDGKDLRSFQDISDTVEWLTFILNEQIPYKIINM